MAGDRLASRWEASGEGTFKRLQLGPASNAINDGTRPSGPSYIDEVSVRPERQGCCIYESMAQRQDRTSSSHWRSVWVSTSLFSSP